MESEKKRLPYPKVFPEKCMKRRNLDAGVNEKEGWQIAKKAGCQILNETSSQPESSTSGR